MAATSARVTRRWLLVLALALIGAGVPGMKEARALLGASEAKDEKTGQRVALVIGINEWAPNSGLPRLFGAVPDAQRMAEWLHAGYVVRLLTPAQAKELRPTRGNILSQLRSLLDLENVDTLLIYWAGHGVSHNGQAYLMPLDAHIEDPDLTGLSMEQLLRVVADAQVDLAHRIFIVDACRVGANNLSQGFIAALQRASGNWSLITSCAEGETAAEVSPEEADGMDIPPAVESRREDASKDAPVGGGKARKEPLWDVPEAREPHGLFTLKLLSSGYRQGEGSGLSAADANRDHKISIEEAFHHAKAAVSIWCAHNPPHQQTPTGTHVGQLGGGGELLFHVKPIPPPEGWKEHPDKIQPHQIRTPRLNAANRWVIYDDVDEDTILPLDFSGWMWGSLKEQQIAPRFVEQMMQLNIDCRERPKGDKGSCILWQLTWTGGGWNASWAGLGAFSGPDSPTWWAQPGDNRGLYFNLEKPYRFRQLRFSARTPHAGTRVKIKVGILARDAKKRPLILGDSLAYPIETPWLELSSEWTEYTLELKPPRLEVNPHACTDHELEGQICQVCGNNPINPKQNNLERLCSLGVVVEKRQQENQQQTLQVFLDDIYFE